MIPINFFFSLQQNAVKVTAVTDKNWKFLPNQKKKKKKEKKKISRMEL